MLYELNYIPAFCAWTPLGHLLATFLHAPCTMPPALLSSVGVTIGIGYPGPIIDHAFAGDRAVAVLKCCLH